MSADPAKPAQPERRLTLFDTVAIVVGIIIGSGIYGASKTVAGNSAGPAWWLFGLLNGPFDPSQLAPETIRWIEWSGLIFAWLLGGVLAFVGSLCYAELTSTWPQEGGDYVFLSRAFGRRVGFLFAWSQFWIIRPGSIGAMAFIFAQYAARIWAPFGDATIAIYAGTPVILLTIINLLGVESGKWTQNVLFLVKVLGLSAIVVIAYLFADAAPLPTTAAPDPGWSGFSFAMIFVLFTYGGWNDVSYVSAEVQNPETNLPRGLLLGTAIVVAIYLAVSFAFAHVLGVQGMAKSPSVAAETVAGPLGNGAAVTISALVCISCLGAMNGMIFTGARIYYAIGTEHPLWSWLGTWNQTLGTPVRSLLMQGLITLVLIYLFGFLNRDKQGDSFERVVNFTSPAFWAFLLLGGISLIVLRFREPETPRPFSVTLYPITPIVFCAMACFMLYSTVNYSLHLWQTSDLVFGGLPLEIWGLILIAVGGVVCLYDPGPAQATMEAKPPADA